MTFEYTHRRVLGYALIAISIAMAAYHVHAIAFGTPEAVLFRGTHLLFAIVLTFLLYRWTIAKTDGPKSDDQRPVEILGEPVLQPRHGGKTALAPGPVRWGRVLQDEGQAVHHDLVAHGLRAFVIGKEHFHPVETGVFSCGETVHQRQLGEKNRQVRGEAGHQGSSAEGMIGKKVPDDQRPNQRSPSCSSCTQRSMIR